MIYLVSFYYPPEATPGATRFSHLARILCAKYGHQQVRVVTGRPNYPHGILPREFRWRIFKRTTGRWGETVHHLYEIPAPFKGLYRKTLGMLSFGVSAFAYFLFAPRERNDLVIVTSGPIFPAYAIHLASLIRRFRYVVDVRDLWPQIVAGMGFLNDLGFAYRQLMRWSDAVYRRAVLAIGTTEGICDYIRTARTSGAVALVYNPVDTDAFSPIPPDQIQRFRAQHPDVFGRHSGPVLLYSGSFSVTIDPLQILRAVTSIPASLDPFTVVFIGYGEQLADMEGYVHAHGLHDRVAILPFMDRQQLAQYINAADACISCTNPSDINKIAIPTKLIEYLACNKFLILALATPFADELARQGHALVSAPGDAGGLAGRMAQFLEHRGEFIRHVESRAFAVDRFSLNRFTDRILSCLAPHMAPAREPSTFG
jgi:glycosyltransferase involved in cell wall biosynthesis